MRNYLAFIMLIASAMLSAQNPIIVENKKAGNISVIPKEYTVSGAPAIVTTDYDRENHTYDLRQYDAKLENSRTKAFTLPNIEASTKREYGDSTYWYGYKLYILSDTIMKRRSVVINENNNFEKKRV